MMRAGSTRDSWLAQSYAARNVAVTLSSDGAAGRASVTGIFHEQHADTGIAQRGDGLNLYVDEFAVAMRVHQKRSASVRARWQKPRLDAGTVNIEPDRFSTGGGSRARLLQGMVCARKGDEFLQGGDRPDGPDGDQQNEGS